MRLRVLLLIVLPPIVFLLCALLFLRTPLPPPFPPPVSAERDRAFAIVTGILGVGYLIGLAVYATSCFRRAGHLLDPALTSMGLASEGYVAFGRRYRGKLAGRQVEVRIVPPQGIKPVLLDVRVSARLGSRIAIGQRRPLLDCRGCERLEAGQFGLGCLQVYAEEESRARRLLADPAIRDALVRLMKAQKENGSRELYLQPDRVWLRAHPHRVTEELFRQWLEDLLALSKGAEEVAAHAS
jgi:hypothetical protein